ncbi:Uncharacterised protein [Neisseria weaveri]|uniref:Uncharacterized protein n=1 Tax=Neisseria weaveri TaxID=28091 RepID=A0A448VJ86_9NEIS|nr:hypothetical protein l11_20810 [Neisseria weaveri LMG 5135]SAY51169.1 Uncharacterised protein [Neisseria weaveri]VEJ49818.1 Uncharacterised protein [Neisseria weaveri]
MGKAGSRVKLDIALEFLQPLKPGLPGRLVCGLIVLDWLRDCLYGFDKPFIAGHA